MKITFIRPHLTDTRSLTAMEPLAFAVLAGLTPPDIELAFYDERIESIPANDCPDLLALSVETFTARRAYEIADAYRDRGVTVVMGGYHVTFCPDEALQHADAVVIGDAEGVWLSLLKEFQAGRLQRRYRQDGQPPLDGLRFDRRIFEGKPYARVVPVQYSRGCRYACDFCSIHAFYGSTLRSRPVTEVVAEIEALNRQYVLLVDDNLFVDVPRAEALFRALIPLRIRWCCQISIDVARNDRLMDLMARSGCFGALIGFESLNEGNLRRMGKWWNVKGGGDPYGGAIAAFHDRGIMIYGSFILGYDEDTPDVFDRTAEFALRSRLALVNFNTLTPTPGTGLYERLKKQGRLIRDPWWLDRDYRYGQSTFHPSRMTPEQLTDGCLKARREAYSVCGILGRSLNRKANARSLSNLVLFVAANWSSRRELSRKLGRTLGSSAATARTLAVHSPDNSRIFA